MQLLQVLFKQLFEKQISKRYKADLMVRLNSITHTPNSQSSKIFFFCPDSCQGKETDPYIKGPENENISRGNGNGNGNGVTVTKVCIIFWIIGGD